MTRPTLSIQTASLVASGLASQFAGSGGPFGFSPDTRQFGGVISSAGLAADPFQDMMWDVDAGDQVTFVAAVQNLADGAGAFDVLLRDTIPAGFQAPAAGVNLSVTDGAGNVIAATGDLFDPAGGLLLGAPIAGYDPDSGQNVALVTFTLQAADTIASPLAVLSNATQIVSYAALPGGPDLSADLTPGQAVASTTVTTAAPTADVAALAGNAVVSVGQNTEFDVTVTVPEGETRNLSIAELLPAGAGSWLELVSAEVAGIGANLTTALQPGYRATNGRFSFGDVLNAPDNQVNADDTITLKVVARAAGSAGGAAVLRTAVTADDPNAAGAQWSTTASGGVAVAAPTAPPVLSGAWAGQNMTDTMQVQPFTALAVADPDPNATETLTIQLSDPALGSLGALGPGQYDAAAGAYVVRGSAAQVQQAARDLVFSPVRGHAGAATFATTLENGAGEAAQDSRTTLRIAPSADTTNAVQHFAPSPTAMFLTATAAGAQTLIRGEAYQGPVDYLQSQLIYDGTDPIVIVAETPNVFVKNVAGSAAVLLQSGRNVVDAGPGSNFLIGGTGTDVFFLDASHGGVTWDTIVNFHPGDIATLWGFREGVSSLVWAEDAGAAGYTGRTLHADVTGSGSIEASLTFTGQTAADMSHYAFTKGQVGGRDYMAIFDL